MTAQGDRRIGVIGAGAWGTALAQMLAADGREGAVRHLIVAGSKEGQAIPATVSFSEGVPR